jgi:hypothetical protein
MCFLGNGKAHNFFLWILIFPSWMCDVEVDSKSSSLFWYGDFIEKFPHLSKLPSYEIFCSLYWYWDYILCMFFIEGPLDKLCIPWVREMGSISLVTFVGNCFPPLDFSLLEMSWSKGSFICWVSTHSPILEFSLVRLPNNKRFHSMI